MKREDKKVGHSLVFGVIYTILVAMVGSLITYLVVTSRFRQERISNWAASLPVASAGPSLFSEEEPYFESDNPLSNRDLGTGTEGVVIFHGPRDKKKIALTFDAEMTDFMKAQVVSGRVKTSYDKRIVDTLMQAKTKATFFLTGMWIELYPEVTTEFSKNPLFELGSHSYSDVSFHGSCYGLKQLPKILDIEDIGATEKLLRHYGGIDNYLFRFPGGCYGPDDVKLVNQAGDIVVHWDVKGNDGFNNSADLIVRNVVDYVQNGSIIILHMNGVPTAPRTAEALPKIISTLKSRGFEFVKVSELLGLPPEPRVQASIIDKIEAVLGANVDRTRELIVSKVQK